MELDIEFVFRTGKLQLKRFILEISKFKYQLKNSYKTLQIKAVDRMFSVLGEVRLKPVSVEEIGSDSSLSRSKSASILSGFYQKTSNNDPTLNNQTHYYQDNVQYKSNYVPKTENNHNRGSQIGGSSVLSGQKRNQYLSPEKSNHNTILYHSKSSSSLAPTVPQMYKTQSSNRNHGHHSNSYKEYRLQNSSHTHQQRKGDQGSKIKPPVNRVPIFKDSEHKSHISIQGHSTTADENLKQINEHLSQQIQKVNAKVTQLLIEKQNDKQHYEKQLQYWLDSDKAQKLKHKKDLQDLNNFYVDLKRVHSKQLEQISQQLQFYRNRVSELQKVIESYGGLQSSVNESLKRQEDLKEEAEMLRRQLTLSHNEIRVLEQENREIVAFGKSQYEELETAKESIEQMRRREETGKNTSRENQAVNHEDQHQQQDRYSESWKGVLNTAQPQSQTQLQHEVQYPNQHQIRNTASKLVESTTIYESNPGLNSEPNTMQNQQETIKQQQVRAYHEMVEKLSGNIKHLQQTYEGMERANNELSIEIQQLHLELQNKRGIIEIKDKQLLEMDSVIRKLENRIASAEKQSQLLQAQLPNSNSKAKVSQEAENWERQKQKMSRIIAQLTNNINHMETQLEQIENQRRPKIDMLDSEKYSAGRVSWMNHEPTIEQNRKSNSNLATEKNNLIGSNFTHNYDIKHESNPEANHISQTHYYSKDRKPTKILQSATDNKHQVGGDQTVHDRPRSVSQYNSYPKGQSQIQATNQKKPPIVIRTRAVTNQETARRKREERRSAERKSKSKCCGLC